MNRKLKIHNKFYLKENRYKKPKESFKFLINLLTRFTKKNKKYQLLDIGCANGELIFNLEKKFKNFEIKGTDIDKELLKKAQKNCKNKENFFVCDISKKKLNIGKFDIIIIQGVLCYYDDPSVILRNLKNSLNKNGQIFLFDNLNVYPLETYVKYMKTYDKKKVLYSGWNVHSIDKIKSFFKGKKKSTYKFNIKKNIKKNPTDIMRSWTILLDKKRHFTNAINMIQNQYWLRIY